MYYKPTKFDKIIVAIFEEMKILNFFLRELPLILRVDRKKKETGNICKGAPDIEFEQDWSLGLCATLRDREKSKNYFSSFKDFFGKSRYSHIVGLRMYYKHTKFKQNR